MSSLLNKQLLLTAYAYLFIMEQQKELRGSDALNIKGGSCCTTANNVSQPDPKKSGIIETQQQQSEGVGNQPPESQSVDKEANQPPKVDNFRAAWKANQSATETNHNSSENSAPKIKATEEVKQPVKATEEAFTLIDTTCNEDEFEELGKEFGDAERQKWQLVWKNANTTEEKAEILKKMAVIIDDAGKALKFLWDTNVQERDSFTEIWNYLGPKYYDSLKSLDRNGGHFAKEYIENNANGYLFGEIRKNNVHSAISAISSKFAESVAGALSPEVEISQANLVDVARDLNLTDVKIVEQIVEVIVNQTGWGGLLKTQFEKALRAYIAEVAVALTEVRQDGRKLGGLEENMKNNQLVCMAAVQNDVRALKYAGDDMKRNQEVLIAAAQTGPAYLLCEVLPSLGITPLGITQYREVVMAAVRTDFRALVFAGDIMRNDREVVMAAVQINASALEDAGPDMRNDPAVVKAAVLGRYCGWKWESLLALAGPDVNQDAIRKDKEEALKKGLQQTN